MQFTNHLTSDGTSTIKNLPAPTAAGDAAPKSYVDSAVEGLSWKAAVRAKTTGNVIIANPGTAVFDGVTLVNGDRLLVGDDFQTSGAQAGIYVFSASGSPLVRAADANTTDELENAVVTVKEGTTQAGTTWRQSAQNFTLGSGNQTWLAFGVAVPAATESTAGIAEVATSGEITTGTDDTRIVTPLKLAGWAGRALRYSVLIGDGVATAITVTHNLGTEDVDVIGRLAGGTKEGLIIDWKPSTTNSVIVTFATAPASNSVRITVQA